MVASAQTDLPLQLWALHRASAVGDLVPVPNALGRVADARRRADLVIGGGFAPAGDDHLQRVRTLADTCRPGLRLLCIGLNPSLYAADAGVGFARPGNRFWPAALLAGVVTIDRDPYDAVVNHGVGMTDLVKRATPRAAELARHELVDGLGRLERLCAWLRPRAACVLGLTGWRAATGLRDAGIGWQPIDLGGTPVYLMPNPSGLNARVPLVELAGHLRTAAGLPGP